MKYDYSRFIELVEKYRKISNHWMNKEEEKPVMSLEERTELLQLEAHFYPNSYYR
jgi:hypothetical protein